MCLATCAATFIGYEALESAGILDDNGLLMWGTDTFGVGAFCVIGAQVLVLFYSLLHMHLRVESSLPTAPSHPTCANAQPWIANPNPQPPPPPLTLIPTPTLTDRTPFA
jgi:hypothetical protein